MFSKDLIAEAKKKNAADLAAAFKSGDAAKMEEALATFMSDVHDAVLSQAAMDLAAANADAAVLASRGRPAMTSEERAYFEGLAKCMKDADPKMALNNWNVAMPQTIIDDAISGIKKDHPLLAKLKFQPTSYLTSFILNDQPGQGAAWGPISSKIVQELTGKLKKVDLTLMKLSAFMVIPNDLLELGPQYLADYVKATIFEADAYQMEVKFVCGTGHEEPVGMDRDVSGNININTGYPKQSATKVSDFSPTSLGAIVSKLCRTPGDPTKARAVADLIMLVNPFDYWEKVRPATTYPLPSGGYLYDQLPIPAEIIQSIGVDRGQMILGIPLRYFVGVGPTGKEGSIVYDDSVGFYDDARVYRGKIHCNAFPMDEYAFVLCDISELVAVLAKTVSVSGVVQTEAAGS